MKVVIQRVTNASVTVKEEVVGSIQKGLCILLGINRNDTIQDAQQIVKKVLSLKLWSSQDDDKSWQRNIMDIGGDILIVSQFTLYAITDKGSKPDFHEAMKTEEAKKLFDDTVKLFKDAYPQGVIQTGAFGQMMSVKIFNDGPVTINLESKR